MEMVVGPPVSRGPRVRTHRCVIGVVGMSCASCVGTIERKLRSHGGERRRLLARVGSEMGPVAHVYV